MSAEANASAAETSDPEIKRQLLDLAARWRELAREADEIDAATEAADDTLSP